MESLGDRRQIQEKGLATGSWTQLPAVNAEIGQCPISPMDSAAINCTSKTQHRTVCAHRGGFLSGLASIG
ncbi:hypothetical protein PC111_g302 [Phytophthora cactorum]|nr:hypothetical protein PC111_g302 [Phytophthora cactorum]KAG2849141.1 hypothetical protein PC112_g451 [Phytophthora cactorum]